MPRGYDRGKRRGFSGSQGLRCSKGEEEEMIKTDVSDFNLHWLPQFGPVKFLVAGRCFDAAPDRWEGMACEWYARHGFQELKDDRYATETAVRYKSVDALAAEKPMQVSALGSHLYDSWMARKAELAKNRKEPIEPPKPLPPTKPEEPKDEPKPQPKPEEPKPKSKIPWKTITAVLSAISFALTFLPVPGIVKEIIGHIVKILQSIPG